MEQEPPYELETPDDLESIYLARGDEVMDQRPTFTGDVYRVDDTRLVMILQHPCALRGGTELHPKLLVAPVNPDNGLRTKWVNLAFSKMPLPKLLDGQNHSADFNGIDLVESACLPDCPRVAILSLAGVNLLMQRWTHHNTRLTVPTHRYATAVVGPFDEADLIEEWVTDRADDGMDAMDAEQECAAWLDVKVSGRERRQLLADTQQASSVRREARAHRKSNKYGG